MSLEEFFPAKDITFRSKRKQGDWGAEIVTTTEGYFIEQPAVSTTLESVIKYLRNRKTADTEARIMQAAINYLEEYRLLKIDLRHKEEEKKSDETDSGNVQIEEGAENKQSENRDSGHEQSESDDNT